MQSAACPIQVRGLRSVPIAALSPPRSIQLSSDRDVHHSDKSDATDEPNGRMPHHLGAIFYLVPSGLQICQWRMGRYGLLNLASAREDRGHNVSAGVLRL